MNKTYLSVNSDSDFIGFDIIVSFFRFQTLNQLFLTPPLTLQTISEPYHRYSHPQYKFTVRIPRIQHPMRLMDIRKIKNTSRFGNPISVLDMPYNFLQRDI